MTSVTRTAAVEACLQRFKTAWGTTTPVTFDNEAFDGDKQTRPWVRLSVRIVGSEQHTLGPVGARRFRRDGLAFVQVFTLANTGTAKGTELSEQAAAIFEGVSFNGLDFGAAQVLSKGTEGKWYVNLVEVPFDFDETK